MLKPEAFGRYKSTPSPMESGSVEGDTPVVCILCLPAETVSGKGVELLESAAQNRWYTPSKAK